MLWLQCISVSGRFYQLFFNRYDRMQGMHEKMGGKMKTINIMLDDGIRMPERAHENDAGLDIFSPKRTWVFPHNSAIIDTGVHVEIPKGYVGILKSKSGLNVKHGLTGTGTIDAGYTGSIIVKLYNSSNQQYLVGEGDKIIQLVIFPIETPEPVLVDHFEETERGENGFGSTGK